MNRITYDWWSMEKNHKSLSIFVDMTSHDEPIYLACRRALVRCHLIVICCTSRWMFTHLFSKGLDGASEISGLLSNVQDIDALTDHVINVVRIKMREQPIIRVKSIDPMKINNHSICCCFWLFRTLMRWSNHLSNCLWTRPMHLACTQWTNCWRKWLKLNHR